MPARALCTAGALRLLKRAAINHKPKFTAALIRRHCGTEVGAEIMCCDGEKKGNGKDKRREAGM